MANFNFNKIMLGGRIATDVELKRTAAGVSVMTFLLAVNRRVSGAVGGENAADFIPVIAWRGTAEFIARFFRRGSSIALVGSVRSQMREENGVKRRLVEIVAEEAYFVDAKSEASGSVPQSADPAGEEDMPF